ncbi:hypothetical protein [Algoriphagus terrigena]|uniref:hypothetical protein n=1 Tax=Algoriphagus terrigena TaxID=344884 RepID=UPI0003F894F2|nr:hypothetical protein [Algoriphagus terrigena]
MSEELKKLINTLSVNSFRDLVQEYCKEKYSTKHVRITDGPYDGGNDLEIIVDGKELRKNIQITVQKSGYERKLEKDIVKSAENVAKYGYLNKLDFYTSQDVPKDTVNKLVLNAEVKYGIDLKIIDAKSLASEASSFSSIRKVAYKSHGINETNSFSTISKESKLLFDVLTLNSNTVEVRKNIIYSLIFSYLYTAGDSTIDEISEGLRSHLQTKIDTHDLLQELNYLKSRRFILTPNAKSHYCLSEEKRLQIEEINDRIILEENQVEKEIEDFISYNNLNCTSLELVEFLKQIHTENYKIDIEEINQTESSFSASLRRSYSDLQRFIESKGGKSEEIQKITKELLEKCSENSYFNKLATTSLFSNLYASDKLESYINDRKKTIVIDTQILIRILCVWYQQSVEFNDTAFDAVQKLMTAFNRYRSSIILQTTEDYVEEVAGHFEEAIKLQRFLKLPFIEDIGSSKNVFFNAFLTFKAKDIIDSDMDFDEFIEDLIGEPITSYKESHFFDEILDRLIDLFEAANFEIIYHPKYEDYQGIKKAYEINLAYAGKERSYKAREHDLRTMLYLSNPENHKEVETGQHNEPFLITWDSAFYGFRKELSRINKQLSFWYIYSPLKMVDRLSILNFKISPKAVTSNVIALAETNFNYSNKTSSFFDVISTLFNKEDVSELSIIKRLADLRKETLEQKGNLDDSEIRFGSSETPLTNLLLDIRNYYGSAQSQYNLTSLISAFEIEDNSDSIVSLLANQMNDYKPLMDLAKLYSEFDKLIENTSKI